MEIEIDLHLSAEQVHERRRLNNFIFLFILLLNRILILINIRECEIDHI